MRFKYPLLLLVWAWSLTGCQGLFPRFTAVATPPSDPQAEAMLNSGDYAGAMSRYEQLATTSGTPDHYWLEAADAALKSGDNAAARSMAGGIRQRELSDSDTDRLMLLLSRIDLNEGSARNALDRLNGLKDHKLGPRDEKNYHILRASALNQLGDMIGSAGERVALGKLLARPDDIQRNNEVIAETLDRVPDRHLVDNQPPPPDVLGGWMSLIHIKKQTSKAGLAAATAEWRARYPGHPAGDGFLQKIMAGVGPDAIPADSSRQAAGATLKPLPTGPFVGVMLPLSGPYATASEAIRTGMIAAQEADRGAGKPALYFADTSSGNLYATYRRLADGGAKAVVGPLVKEDIKTLVKDGDLPTPVLALNQINDLQNPKLYQFGLTPEQEIEQVAGSAWFEGKQEALVLAPDSAFGKRLSRYFEQYWASLGGRILETRKYAEQNADFSRLTGNLPTTSGNAFVFLVADPQNARAILPKIAPYPSLPVYATSHAYDGKSGEAANASLDGMIFCDMPWLLNADGGGMLSARAMEARIGSAKPDTIKLTAMGLDAYRLVAELARLKADPYYSFAGATGTLAILSDNRIQRQLECAQFKGASAQRHGNAPLLKTGQVHTSGW